MYKALEGLKPLKNKVAVYVPATVDVDKAVDNTEFVRRVARALSDWFGGATSTPAIGYWTTMDDKMVEEHTTVVYAYCNNNSLERYLGGLVDLCTALKVEMAQEAVALELNGEMYFV